MRLRDIFQKVYVILWFAVCCFYADSRLHGGNAAAYYVNMDISKDRRTFMHNQLTSLNYNPIRIAAIAGAEVPQRVKLLIGDNCKPRELACTMSHLSAWYEASYGKSAQKDSNYALILEDDVSFEMDFDLERLIASAPSDFAILQLTTSNAEEVRNLWEQYVAEVNVTGNKNAALWKAHESCHGYWSTQAYVINKKVVKSALDRTVKNLNGVLAFELGPPDGFRNVISCQYRLVADVYLYAMGKTYVTRVPLLNGHSIGQQSLIRNDAVKNVAQIKSFKQIQEVLDLVGQSVALLPSFIQPMSKGNIDNGNQELQLLKQQRQHPDTVRGEMSPEKDDSLIQQLRSYDHYNLRRRSHGATHDG